jgi:hypothetical protein
MCASLLSMKQTWDLPPGLRASAFGDCTRFFAFACSASDAALLAKEFGGSDGQLVAEMLPDLKTGQVLVKIRGEPVVLLRVLPAGSRPRRQEIEEGLAQCLQLGAPREHIDREIEQRRRRLLSGREDASPAQLVGASGEVECPEGYADP